MSVVAKIAPAAGILRGSPASSPAEVAAELEALAERTGDPAFHRAARALLADHGGGRPAIDDADLIAEARALFAAGKVPTLNAAFLKVAKTRAGEIRPRSLAERLRRKHAAGLQKSSTYPCFVDHEAATFDEDA